MFIYVVIDANAMGRSRVGNDCIGIDFGLKHFLVTSEGKVYDNPKLQES